jgi:hypothetical protein
MPRWEHKVVREACVDIRDAVKHRRRETPLDPGMSNWMSLTSHYGGKDWGYVA